MIGGGVPRGVSRNGGGVLGKEEVVRWSFTNNLREVYRPCTIHDPYLVACAEWRQVEYEVSSFVTLSSPSVFCRGYNPLPLTIRRILPHLDIAYRVFQRDLTTSFLDFLVRSDFRSYSLIFFSVPGTTDDVSSNKFQRRRGVN